MRLNYLSKRIGKTSLNPLCTSMTFTITPLCQSSKTFNVVYPIFQFFAMSPLLEFGVKSDGKIGEMTFIHLKIL
jgi:hypothetical protein